MSNSRLSNLLGTLKKSRLTVILMGLVGLVLLFWVVLFVFVGGTGTKSSSTFKVKEGYCPDCGHELSKADQASRECSFCKKEKGPDYVKAKKRNQSLATNPVIAIVLISVFCLLLAIHMAFIIRARFKNKTEDVFYTTVCTKCHRRMRYREKQIGHFGLCPLCRKPLRFPAPELKVEKRRGLSSVVSLFKKTQSR